MQDTDILISGAGIAGLVAAAALDHAGFRVMIVDPASPKAAGQTDLRSTAYLQPARQLLENIGLWPALLPHTTPLEALRIIDSSGWPPVISETRTFSPKDLGEDSFGWNIPNAVAHSVLLSHLAMQPRIVMKRGVGFAGMLTRTSEALVRLDDGAQVKCRLVVGADGRNSPVRDAAGIEVDTTRYGQKALAFHATHALPHNRVSTEIYNQGGAFTTVPLPDVDGQPCSAIVWMNDGATAQSLASLPADAFNAEMSRRACDVLGPMTRRDTVNIWPIISQRARSLVAERTVLIAEAAHVLPPIGAQGLNTSLQDAAHLYNLLRNDTAPLGSEGQLQTFERGRHNDIARRTRAIDLFNRICQSNQPAIQAMRSLGLRAVHDITPLRKTVMRAGLGTPPAP